MSKGQLKFENFDLKGFVKDVIKINGTNSLKVILDNVGKYDGIMEVTDENEIKSLLLEGIDVFIPVKLNCYANDIIKDDAIKGDLIEEELINQVAEDILFHVLMSYDSGYLTLKKYIIYANELNLIYDNIVNEDRINKIFVGLVFKNLI